MIKEEFGLGSTIEEATEQAIAKLNPGEADYKIEIIDDVKPKVLGLFGGHPAKVRAYYECPDLPRKKQEKANDKANKKNNKATDKTGKKQEKAKAKAEKEVNSLESKPELNYVELSKVEKGTPAATAANYVVAVLEKLGVTDISVKVAEIENGSQLHIDGGNLGVIIGRRGETLDALQYLASFAANAGTSGYYRIVLDTGNYREKREETLKSLARRIAAQAIRTGRARSLEPMNPYERRIIHTEIQDIEGVSSHSVGDGMRRHVVICPDGVTPRRNDNRDRRGNRGGRDRRNAPSNKVDAPAREPRSDSDGNAPLYGRIG